MNRAVIAAFALGFGVSFALAATPNYTSNTQRVEHVALTPFTAPGNCVRLDMGTGADAAVWLSGEPDAALAGSAPGPDAAVWAAGADAAIWISPDVGQMGPRPGPRVDVSYVCTARNNQACLKQGALPLAGCNYTFVMPADSPMPPMMFPAEPDGGNPRIWGVSSSGTSNLECCPVIPNVATGR